MRSALAAPSVEVVAGPVRRKNLGRPVSANSAASAAASSQPGGRTAPDSQPAVPGGHRVDAIRNRFENSSAPVQTEAVSRPRPASATRAGTGKELEGQELTSARPRSALCRHTSVVGDKPSAAADAKSGAQQWCDLVTPGFAHCGPP